MKTDDITSGIINAAIEIHERLGPGLYESIYEEVMAYELTKRGLSVRRQLAVPVVYDEIYMEIGFRMDILVKDMVIIEIKSIETIAAVHKKQLLSYLRLKNLKTGLIINFNEELLKKGITRVFNNYIT